MTRKIQVLNEIPGRGRLGRHVEHDARSLSFAVEHDANAPLVSKSWTRACAPFDQGDRGSCTGNAMAGALMTDPLYVPGRNLGESDAVALYSAATHLDRIPGAYPPKDTGSSGLAVAKAAQRAGYIKEYHHAFTLHGALAALARGPVIAGIPWYEGFDAPDGDSALLVIAGGVRGGHEIELLAVDVSLRLVRGVNSWGPDWGDHGYFTMTWDTLERLMSEEGDVVVPIAA